ncbi:methanobactin export MATE transporter MbnM [Polyangium sp. 6x1]|uniref:methanobactin export MATE transporter MbnM n=1 Tax=Polyangium sp. 6x1 TaxID=3042689 RepID=UPI002482F944|nr:methanobactin export MATE transporter MbnM [Polyangium sp. 6x1]MDI1450617.1 di-heme enzyme [Polyangium sp. 6x1]
MTLPGGKRLSWALLLGLGAASCRPSAERPTEEPWAWDLPPGFPAPLVPLDNPMSVAKVALGRMLFYDKRLSASESISCATCHQQALAFSDGRTTPVGLQGDIHPRNAPTLTNVAYAPRLNWADPGTKALEAQMEGPLFGRGAPIVEMGLVDEPRREAALARLLADERYREAFERAFPEAPKYTFEHVSKAIASFERTLVSGGSAWDRYRAGDAAALGEAERRGMYIVRDHVGGALCHHCHDGFNLSGPVKHVDAPFDEVVFANIGLYNVGSTGAYPEGNQGLYEHTKNPSDRGKFRTPTLRNVAVTGPYMHDGSVATLEDVIAVYVEGGRVIEAGPYAGDGRKNPHKSAGLSGTPLSAGQRRDVVAFLNALTDEVFLSDARFSNPYPEDEHFGE